MFAEALLTLHNRSYCITCSSCCIWYKSCFYKKTASFSVSVCVCIWKKKKSSYTHMKRKVAADKTVTAEKVTSSLLPQFSAAWVLGVRSVLVFRAENIASSLTSACNVTTQSKAHFIKAVAIKLMGLRLHLQDTVTEGNPQNWHTAFPHTPTLTAFKLH